MLPAGHGHGIVVQNFVGDVDTRRNGLPNGQETTVEIGAIAQVGKHMGFGAEWLLTYPRHTFTAHLREANGRAVHPNGHEMATNPRHGA